MTKALKAGARKKPARADYKMLRIDGKLLVDKYNCVWGIVVGYADRLIVDWDSVSNRNKAAFSKNHTL